MTVVTVIMVFADDDWTKSILNMLTSMGVPSSFLYIFLCAQTLPPVAYYVELSPF